ncbi:F0F1 ATP synthase subunit B [Mycoplasma crocodyli]|uniref:ATP synthase subunit b n=1 Tax=Mycoplasma crocodyli (strain ATCC 51981 / MP145) TaxID=512564 RepID=D5E5G3_MYCCM|nr:F0F1 ATP synthase subunit B [Mycoplasma crocodyli]ADE19484.1 ATP synthase F0, B subunit [Mycoplasma crocodyli MP145]
MNIIEKITNINFAKIDAPTSISESISERFLKIFPNVPMMIATIISFILCFLFLTYFLYKPVKKAMMKRHEFIQKNIDDSIESKIEAAKLVETANEKLKEAHKQSDIVINQAKTRAEKVILSYTTKAKSDAKHLLEEAHLDIESQQIEFERESKKRIAEAAVDLSKKILKKEISKSTQKEIIDDFLKSKLVKEEN